jgi:hypothetical protein
MGRVRLLAVVLGLLAACEAPVEVRRTPFDPAEYARYASGGTAAIEGQAFLRTRDGQVRVGAGCTITINPVTSFSQEWWDRAVVAGEVLAPAPPEVMAASRTAIGDGDGRFRIEGLHAGDYFVVCPIYWEYAYGQTGGIARTKVTVAEGQTAHVVVTL